MNSVSCDQWYHAIAREIYVGITRDVTFLRRELRFMTFPGFLLTVFVRVVDDSINVFDRLT